MKRQYPAGLRHKQQGAVLVLVTIAMLALIAMAGLALDGGHLLLNKTRLQNAVDASALSAARALADFPDDNPVGAHAVAEAAALATFTANLNLMDNRELQDAFEGGLIVQFSTTLNPFTPDTDALPYVRVIAQDLNLASWLLPVVGIDEKPVSASAVAGPIGVNDTVCDVLPILACGCDSTGQTFTTLDDCESGDGNFFGYHDDDNPDIESIDDISVIKLAGGSGTDVGPGNFRLLDLYGKGGASIRDALAGTASECLGIGENTEAGTATGNKAGPTAQGLNTRLGVYQGPVDPNDAPPDMETYFNDSNRLVLASVVDGKPVIEREDGSLDTDGNTSVEGIFDYQDYKNSDAYRNGCTGDGCRRRELVLPIGDCTGQVSGTSDDVHIYTVGCFFLLQDVDVGNDAEVFGQFFSESEGCDVIGTFTDDPVDPGTSFKIVLFRDSDSGDS
jgi:Flp pilus assembly protein TadG